MIRDPVRITRIATRTRSETHKSRSVPDLLPGLARPADITENRYPLPLISELLERISKRKYFTKFDVRDRYNRLRIASGEEWKTAFRCRYGLFEYMVMLLGLRNSPGTFQHYMNDTLRDFLDEFLVVYVDDMLIYSDNLKEH